MSILQGQNLDSTGMQRLDRFFLAAKRASGLVSEATIRVFMSACGHSGRFMMLYRHDELVFDLSCPLPHPFDEL